MSVPNYRLSEQNATFFAAAGIVRKTGSYPLERAIAVLGQMALLGGTLTIGILLTAVLGMYVHKAAAAIVFLVLVLGIALGLMPLIERRLWAIPGLNRITTTEGDPPRATKFKALTKQGLVVGYGLAVLHHVTVSVQVGEALTAEQLSDLHHGRWLAAETALLDVPTGRLCIESRERVALRPERTREPSGRVYVRAGRYRVSLYQSDDAARERESLDWVGPQQVMVLTPGGTRADAADGPLGPAVDPWSSAGRPAGSDMARAARVA